MSEKLDNIMKKEWRSLGFYYERDDDARKWRMIGSPTGINEFRLVLLKYIKERDPDAKFDHDHLGPYGYLKITTWDEPRIIKAGIDGAFEDFERLAEIIRGKLSDEMIGKTFTIKDEYSKKCEYSLEFRVKEYGFDPVEADKRL